MIDLHAHTTASDGSLTPTELVQLALSLGLTALAVTDHDTIDGVPEAVEAAAVAGTLEVVPGIEFSVDYIHGEFHLLGYFVDVAQPAFLSRVRYLQENRFNRNQVMVRLMQEQGFEITLADVEAEAGGGQIGRPHMARAMMRKGYVQSVQEAFNEYLADGKPLHVPKVKLDPAEAIELVHAAGGVAVLAHPRFLGFGDRDELFAELTRLRALGLDGLECYYSQHSPEQTETYLAMAAELDLVITSGSDFHGVSKPDVPLGVVFQGKPGAPELLERLRARRNERLIVLAP